MKQRFPKIEEALPPADDDLHCMGIPTRSRINTTRTLFGQIEKLLPTLL